MRQQRTPSLSVAILIGLSAIITPGVVHAAPDNAWRAEIEADWLNQERVRWQGVFAGVTTAEDAQGGCDGIKDGKWGFHTGLAQDPWWQVDLGDTRSLARADLYNRCDAPATASQLRVYLSADAADWREVYAHDGTVFYGFTDGIPLSIDLSGQEARYLRVAFPGQTYCYFDEIEVYGLNEPERNLALWQPADQVSTSQWSAYSRPPGDPTIDRKTVERALDRDAKLASALADLGVDVSESLAELAAISERLAAGTDEVQRLYLDARWVGRRMAFASPLIDFDELLFAKRVPGSFTHMSDQYYGWWSRPGGGLFVLSGLRDDAPALREIPVGLPEGSFLGPELSPDGTKVLFAHCKYYPDLAGNPDKMHKENVPEDAFYHIYEIGLDGSGLRQLTAGRYDDFDARYLPSGEIVFLSTRRGTFLQCGKQSAMETLTAMLPDSYVRCGGDAYRPVSVYTLHVMDADGGQLRTISPFENFEWTPSVTSDGRIIYARWDYVDRNNMPYMSLWSTNPDGSGTHIAYGNFTTNPHCIFEARSIPNSSKLMFTASGHHAMTAGSICLLDPNVAVDGESALTRLTPEVCFPEAEGWPNTYFANPYPLSEWQYLAAWSNLSLASQGGGMPVNAMGLYLCDAFGGLELIYRDPEITSMYPIPVRQRPSPPALVELVDWDAQPTGEFLLMDVYQGLPDIERGSVKSLRVVGLPAKTHPVMNFPSIGLTADDPGKVIIGTVPVEADGSANFTAPAGMPMFFQALDERGRALQTMRSAAYVQPGEKQACIGCHEPRTRAPANGVPTAASREPSLPTPGPEGTWPMRYDRLVQPVLDASCVQCHSPDAPDPGAAAFNLAPEVSYETLVNYGAPSLLEHVKTRYGQGASPVGQGASHTSSLLALLEAGHHGVQLSPADWERLVTWMDVYAQRAGSYSPEQEEQLERLRQTFARAEE